MIGDLITRHQEVQPIVAQPNLLTRQTFKNNTIRKGGIGRQSSQGKSKLVLGVHGQVTVTFAGCIADDRNQWAATTTEVSIRQYEVQRWTD